MISHPLTAVRLASALTAGVAVLTGALLLALACGPDGMRLADLALVVSSGADGEVLREARLTRVLMGGLAGGALGLCGAVLQALMRNPLADPYVVGVSGGAAVGGSAAVAVLDGSALAAALPTLAVELGLPLGAYLGALLALLLIHLALHRGGGVSSGAVLLAGVVFNAFCLALVSVIRLLIRAETAQALLGWMMGTITSETFTVVGITMAYVAAGGAWLVALAGRLQLMAQGDDTASRLGVAVEATRRQAYLAVSLMVAAVVSVTGMIGFVGLMVPHLSRGVLGSDARLTIPMSFLGGAALLMLCDAAARVVFPWFGTELPVGALTALMGGPAFLWIMQRGHASGR